MGPDPYTLGACRVAGVLKQLPDPTRAQCTAVVPDAVKMLEYSLCCILCENVVPGIPKFFGHLRVSTGQVLALQSSRHPECRTTGSLPGEAFMEAILRSTTPAMLGVTLTTVLVH